MQDDYSSYSTGLEGTLFDPQTNNNGMSNSINHYHKPAVQMIAQSQKYKVYDAIKTLGEACDRDIAEFTGIELNLIPDRRKKLLAEGLIYISSNRNNPKTRATVNYYKIRKEVKN